MSPNREAHVREVMAIMAAGDWRTGTSHAKCMSSWGVSEDNVRRVAGEASRRLRALAGGHDDEIRGRLLVEIERIGDLALEATYINGDGVAVARPDYRAALAAIELRAKLLGMLALAEADRERRIAWTVASPDEKREAIVRAETTLEAARADLARDEEQRRNG